MGVEVKRDAWLIESKPSRLAPIGLVAMLISLLPAWADPAPGASNGPASGVSPPNPYLIVRHLGESEQQASVREGQLLSRHRATDPFGNSIRGPFKGLPPVVEHPTLAQSVVASPVTPPVNEPTIEKAVEELTIGAVDVSAHEILIGARSISEGDLMVLESGGRQFAVWVQSVGVHGVLLCDIDMQKQILKPFCAGPKELPANSDSGVSDIRSFLHKEP
jgi:hypothetical protein